MKTSTASKTYQFQSQLSSGDWINLSGLSHGPSGLKGKSMKDLKASIDAFHVYTDRPYRIIQVETGKIVRSR